MYGMCMGMEKGKGKREKGKGKRKKEKGKWEKGKGKREKGNRNAYNFIFKFLRLKTETEN